MTDLIERLLAEGDATRMTRRRGAWNAESAAVATEAAKALEALQADNERLQAEVTRLLTAFDGLDLDPTP